MKDWQPIETAPRDGTYILAWFSIHEHQVVAFYTYTQLGKGRWETKDGWSDFDSEPTHWMPLPEPPKEAQ